MIYDACMAGPMSAIGWLTNIAIGLGALLLLWWLCQRGDKVSPLTWLLIGAGWMIRRIK